MDMTVTSLLGAATMNNTFCLSVFLGLVWGRGLKWTFSAETTAILAAEAVMVVVCMSRVTPTWRAAIPLLLFPTSLLLVWLLENVVGWD